MYISCDVLIAIDAEINEERRKKTPSVLRQHFRMNFTIQSR